MSRKILCVLGIMFFLVPVFAQESGDESDLLVEDQGTSVSAQESGDESDLLVEDQGASVSAQESDTDPYLSIEDQEAILDKAADAIIEATVIAEHKEDSPPAPTDAKRPYLVRIEVYSRMRTSYIAVGDLSLEPGFFSWMHDGRKQNGYAVYMYPVTTNASKIKRSAGVVLLYGKSFRSAEEALAEIQTRGTRFNRLIRYRPVINEMRERLSKAPYQGGSK
jgi:hypothetical protein